MLVPQQFDSWRPGSNNKQATRGGPNLGSRDDAINCTTGFVTLPELSHKISGTGARLSGLKIGISERAPMAGLKITYESLLARPTSQQTDS